MTDLTAKQWTIDELKDAHKFSMRNFEAIKSSHKAGCFYCCNIFDANEVTEWITENDGKQTALCPECQCHIDAVIGDASHPITDEFLTAMNDYFFY